MAERDMTPFDHEDILTEAMDRVKQGVQGSLEEAIEQIKKELCQKENFKIPYTTLIETTFSLPFHLRKVYFYLLEKGGSTLPQIAEGCRVNFEQANKSLRQLVDHGFIATETKPETNELMYFISRFKEIRREKQIAWRAFLFGPYIPLIFHYNLLCDSSRLKGFQKVIDKVVKDGDIVADVGTGTGIFALLAAKKAKKVYAVEIDPFILEAAKSITGRYPERGKIEFVEADGKSVELGERVDVIICEMLDTALIGEDEVPVMNHAVANLLKPGGRVVPLQAETRIELVKSDYSFYGFEFAIPYHEEYGARPVVEILSNSQLLHFIRFDEINLTRVEKEIVLEAIKDGIINGFRLKTFTYVDEDTLLSPSKWLNPSLVFPLGNSRKIMKGQRVTLSIFYEMGMGPGYVSYSLV